MGSSDRETYTVEILEPTIKGQIYIQASKVKKDRYTYKNGNNNQI